jgi:acetyl esterase/lipase
VRNRRRGALLVGVRAALATLLVALVVGAGAVARVAGDRLGSGASEVWVLRPSGHVRSVVVFAHGWSTVFPWQGFAVWVAHLRAKGNIVIYPRYRVSVNDSTASALAGFRQGLQIAFRSLGPLHVPVVALGKSFGGSAVFDYAAEARSWGLPAPVAVVSIFPALPIDGALPPAPLPAHDQVEIFVGDRDTTAGSAGADAFWQWLAGHPIARKRYVLVHSRPGFIANHDSAQLSDPIARAVFWKPVDELIASATRIRAAASSR